MCALFFTRSFSAAITVFFVATMGSVAPGRSGEMPDQMKSSQQAAEAQFLAENELAMSRMMAGMSSKPTGDIDRDFVDMMVPHHQGAIDMALAELKYGHNQQLRDLAQTIVTNQQREIVAMRRAIGEPSSAASPAPEASGPPMPHPTMNTSDGSMSDSPMK